MLLNYRGLCVPNAILIEGTLAKFQSLVDGTVRIIMDTHTPSEALALLQAGVGQDSIDQGYNGLFPDKFMEKTNGATRPWSLQKAEYEAKMHNKIRRQDESETAFIDRIQTECSP